MATTHQEWGLRLPVTKLPVILWLKLIMYTRRSPA